MNSGPTAPSFEHRHTLSVRIYLDCCCYNRPFDDLSQIRVRLEAEAVEWILEESRAGRFTIVTSDYLSLELLRNPDPVKRADTQAMTAYADTHVIASESVKRRAEEIEAHSIKGLDALHIAAAEAAGCDYLVTNRRRTAQKIQATFQPTDGITAQPIEIVSLP